MGNDRYQMTLEEIPGIILDIQQKGVLMGTSTNRIESDICFPMELLCWKMRRTKTASMWEGTM